MNRKNLFKGKRKDNGEWVEGYYVYDYAHDSHYIFANMIATPNGVHDTRECFSLECYEIDPTTLCQYTGLNDKNGKKIWENDIIEDEITGDVGTVKWYCEDYAGWCVNDVYIDEQQFTEEMWNECEVKGNIFDNPELLDG